VRFEDFVAEPDQPIGLQEAIADGDAARLLARAALAGRRADLPLRYWRQQAHLTTPAANGMMALKAVEGGTAPVARMLKRLGLTGTDLADRLDLPVSVVADRLAQPVRAPLVMLDGEDAIAPSELAAERGLRVAADTFADADWGDGGAATLRFYRPPGFNLETTVRDLYTLLWRLRARVEDPARFPLDGIVFPKIEHPEEADLVNDLLARAEASLGLGAGQIRVSYLIESGWGAAQLAEIAQRAAPRLAALIFGLVDFSADLALPTLASDHLLADWARAEIVTVAGAVGVPAVDGMTLDFPVTSPALDAAANRTRWLDRMRLVYDDAVRARELGMLGKWVGHPAQLLAVLLAFDAALSDEAIECEAAKLNAYSVAVAADQGAMMIDGVMSDRATDRHARVLLRQAAALGRFEPARALTLGIIDAAELAEAERAHEARTAGQR
jgi:citrate lyase subunit beta/citryl-CoA lyase